MWLAQTSYTGQDIHAVKINVCVQTGVDVAKLLSHKKKLEAKRLRKEKKAAKKAKKEAKKRAKEAVKAAKEDTVRMHGNKWENKC